MKYSLRVESTETRRGTGFEVYHFEKMGPHKERLDNDCNIYPIKAEIKGHPRSHPDGISKE